MVKTLTQSIEQIDVNGQTWTQRRGSPSGKNKENKKENAVVFIHGLGSRAYTFRQVSVLLQEKGYETFAPDVVGHGDSEKPSSNGGFKYDERSYVDAMETYGADSFVGRLASTFQGSTDTTFYIIAVYFGSVGIRKTRHAVTCGLIADAAGIVAAIFIAYIFFGAA